MAAKNIINFTHRALDALPPASPGKRPAYFDSKMPNLCVLVTDKGSKTFYVRKVINGKSKRVRLGAYPDLSVENARNMALQVKNAIATGSDPFTANQDKKLEPTLNEFFDIYMQRHALLYKKPESIRMDNVNYDNHLREIFGNYKLSSITRRDVEKLHQQIGATRIYQANRVLALLSVIYNKAILWETISCANPTIHISPFKERSRDRFITEDEFPRFFAALDAEPNSNIKDYVLLSLFTGARKTNILSMQWADISFTQKTWHIPETKNGEPQSIPLIEAALSILKQRHKLKIDESKYVFPSHSKTGHMVEPKSGWKRILDRAGIENLRLHDLRRTLGSYQAINGTSLHIIGKSLGHKSLTATQVYSRLTDDPVRQSMSDAVGAMMQHVKGDGE